MALQFVYQRKITFLDNYNLTECSVKRFINRSFFIFLTLSGTGDLHMRHANLIVQRNVPNLRIKKFEAVTVTDMNFIYT